MRVVRLRATDDGPAHGAARPVALAHLGIRHERAELHRPRALPLAPLITVVGNAGARAHTGAGEHGKAGMALNELPQRGHCADLTRNLPPQPILSMTSGRKPATDFDE